METQIIAALISAVPATVISIVSLLTTLFLHKSLRKEETEPQIRLESICHDPNKMTVYAPTKKKWTSAELHTPEVKEFIEETADTICVREFQDRKYLVMNICKKNYEEADVIVLCNPIELSIKNMRDHVSRLKIMKAYSAINGGMDLLSEKRFNAILYPDNDQRITLNIMYISEQNSGASINIDEIHSSFENRKPNKGIIRIEVDKNAGMDKAGDLIAFTDSSYLMYCEGLHRNFYTTLHLHMVKCAGADDNKKILTVNYISNRTAKNSFRKFYKDALKKAQQKGQKG